MAKKSGYMPKSKPVVPNPGRTFAISGNLKRQQTGAPKSKTT